MTGRKNVPNPLNMGQRQEDDDNMTCVIQIKELCIKMKNSHIFLGSNYAFDISLVDHSR